MSIETVEEKIRQNQVEELVLQFTDLSGVLHSLWVPSKIFSKVAEDGIHTDGSSLGMVDVSKSDLKLVPDLESFIVIPEEIFPQQIGRVMCDIYYPESDKPFELDPRFVLKNTLSEIKKKLGKHVISSASSEIEFFLFRKNENGDISLIDQAGYLASPPADKGANLRLKMTHLFKKMDIVIEKHHHEVPHGKNEFNLPYSDAVKMADKIYLIKFIIKLIAANEGLIASFMPKPFHGEYGAGLHTHINLRDGEKNINLFSDDQNVHGLSLMGQNFMAGILYHAKALAGITNPSVNSYKRLVPGWEAPVYISWANFNRSTLIRIPPGKKHSTRLEYRPTDGSCNFYLAYAALFSAGLDGILKKLEPPAPIEEDIYKMSHQERIKRGIRVLPENLGEALNELKIDPFLKEALGSRFINSYLAIKEKEWKEFSVYVHDWERKRYLDV